jgi:hypothetical protein
MENAWDKPHKALEEILDHRIVFYSVDAPMDEVAVEGKAVFIMNYDEFWGGEGMDYRSEIKTNPTWLDVAVLADAAIRCTGDTHHCFLEGLQPVGESILGAPIYEFIMGS